jgi:hypothetical protein
MYAHSGADEPHPGAVETHNEVGWLILVLWRLTFELWKPREAMNAHPRIVNAHPEAIEVHSGVLNFT